jgi:hypothetical protein
MITSRRDYLMQILEEVCRLLARVSAKRRKGDSDDSDLETVVFGLQRLFGLDADQVFLLTPDQHFELLCDDEIPEFARDNVLLYAALCVEAGHIYLRQGNRAMSRATFVNALRFTLKARAKFSSEGLPHFAPKVNELLALLGDEPLDATTARLVHEQKNFPAPSG